ncbi:hypothetical protein IFJ82_05700 [Novacetimonas hansenii]|uniref:MFS transporter n=2 Tax=Novacetimonas hansenii TaxID=436 RepID=A0ABQ0SBI2_NOVHA|nr:hypothetical protein [Novacetimonas hansenii]EFG83589.1 hypothetical protein GXY_12418 [Novacetimonas hansenii ATCC 23769]MBL7235429.1 hypothetical protein [Novacetimonas hansenii]PYD72244.1 hypothetical protein CFR74_10750 [Novacetimonas hansenii]QOF96086.1 hypothetical protein IFJ82_05700 [Novacetimonas hansenii]RFP04459.1 hypothetical protein BGC30_05385 [Novacetimonas hansenii]
MHDHPITPGQQRRIGLLIVALSTSSSVAILLLIPLVSGFVGLLRDVLSVLILPFSLMFGMSGTSVDQSSALSQIIDSMGHGAGQHPWRTAIGAITGVGGAFAFVMAERVGGRLAYITAMIATAVAMGLCGLPGAAFLLPTLLTEGIFVLSPPATDGRASG